MLRFAAVAVVSLALVAGSAAAGGGPSPGAVTGWDGVLAPGGATRYVALPSGSTTAVAAVRVRTGRVERYASVRGTYGIPRVAYDGSTGGVSADGRTLVLASFAGAPRPGAITRFAILSTKRLKRERLLELRGSWSFDALSPDGRLLYAVQYLGSAENARYRVRAIELASGRLLAGSVADSSEAPGEMRGSPMTRATSRDGGWAYTLYAKPNGTAFVHALDTRHRKAVCIDLPWRGIGDAIGNVRMAVRGGALVLTQRSSRLATIDTRAFVVRAFRRPAAP
ncbi:MAG: hypothetical protein MSC30_00445 [Gaiellaceae bacterium MAG52_C11]|nr:hypothetical protein [Candidatus Gaiellasilicea maunaloa]